MSAEYYPDLPTDPYQEHALELSAALTDPSINTFEHTVNWPRLKALLPTSSVQSILDFGCGPGNFTNELTRIYPKARITGADASAEIFPKDMSPHSHIQYTQWDGQVPKKFSERNELLDRIGTFDLVIAKMSLHYMQDNFSYLQRWHHLLNPGASVVFSVPHPEVSASHIEADTHSKTGLAYATEIGKSGITGTMMHRSVGQWIENVKDIHSLFKHRTIIDEPANEAGVKRRLNVLFCPPRTNPTHIVEAIRAQEGIADRLSVRERLLGKFGIDCFMSAHELNRGLQSSTGRTALLIRDGRLVSGQKEAEY